MVWWMYWIVFIVSIVLVMWGSGDNKIREEDKRHEDKL